MALGDYANSRGAADMGILPDFLPGYAHVSDPAVRAAFGKLWGAELPSAPGMDARAIMNAAAAGSLRALYVVGANPVKTFSVPTPDRLAGLDLLVVQDMFLTETAQRADIVLPAASSYEKDGTLTNTAGEVQMTRRAVDSQGPRTDFDLLRILIHQLSALGLGTAMRARTPEAVFEEIQRHVSGYSVSMADLLMGRAENAVAVTAAADTGYDVGAGAVFSSNDTLFTSGTLGRYCSKLTSCNEAKDIPWSSSPTTQSWWYR
jgi:NADH-quinone oxidoreductase subunit G